MKNLHIYRASAGSGKTHALTREYLKLAFAHQHRFRNILAVTFTNKAAGEMKDRIVSELIALSEKGEKSPHFAAILETFPEKSPAQIAQEAQTILENVLHNYSFFSVSTIDSFVQKVIRSFAYEIGMQSGYRVELDYKRVIAELTELLYRKIDSDSRLLNWLISFARYKVDEGKNWDFRQQIDQLANQIFKEEFYFFEKELDKENLPEHLKLVNKRMREDLHGFRGQMRQISEKARRIVEQNAIDYTALGRNFRTIANYLLNKISAPGKTSDYELGATLIEALEDFSAWHAKSAKKEIVEQIRVVYPALRECLQQASELLENKYEDYLNALHTIKTFHAFGILSDIYQLLPAYRDDNNLLLISDATLLLKEIVAANDTPFIYEKVGNMYQHILIDEFQDTSGFQWENFKPLIFNSLADGYFNLVVGDIKQSIYRWRGGDWKLLLSQVEKDIGKPHIQEVPLETNWRSRKNIVDFNNAIFRLVPEILQQEYNSEIGGISQKLQEELLREGFHQVLTEAYTDTYQFLPPNKNTQGGVVNLKFFEVKSARDKKRKWREALDDFLPQSIENLLERGYKPGEITILVRKNREGQEIVETLLAYMNQTSNATRYGILSAESLFVANSVAVRLLINAMRVLHDQHDSLSFSALLYEISALKRENKDLHSTFVQHFSPAESDFLPPEFSENLHLLKRLSLFELCERLVQMFDLNQAPSHLIYLKTFQDAILSYTRQKSSDLSGFLDWWDEKGGELSVQLSETSEALRIMTIHKAKGLAFRAVIVPYCDWQIDHNPLLETILWCRPQNEPYKLFPALPVDYTGELAKTMYSRDYFDEKLYAFMDALNMLYVAFTRPKDELLIMAPGGESEKITQVSDLLYQAVKKSQTPLQENGKNYVALSEFFSASELLLELEGEVPLKKTEQDSSQHFTMQDYPTNNWREKIAINYHSDDFFKASIQYIQDKVNYGKLMHRVMARIETPADIEEQLLQMYFEGQITALQRGELKEKVEEIMQRPSVKEWFSEKWQVISEKGMVTAQGELRIPDRILIDNKQVLVIDFKFGEARPAHRAQVREYMRLIGEMEKRPVRGFLYYAEHDKVEEV